MGYKIHAFKSISWMTLLRGSTRVVTFLRLAILARILTPAQFGAFGVATLVLSLLEILTETGINVFLIQQKEDIKKYISSAWIVSIIRGCLISLSLILLASPISAFFNSKESNSVILLIALVPFIRGFINPSIVNIQKEMQFHKEFYVRFFLFVIDATIAIVAAFITKSAESFAYGLIVSAIVELAVSFLFFRPFPDFSFERIKVKQIIRRGYWVTITGIFSYSGDNGDNFMVGRLLGTSSLGFYQVAYKLSTITISEITEVVNKVTFPLYSKFSDDKDRLLKAFWKVTSVSSLIAFLAGLFIFLFSEQIVLLLLGKNWISITPVVQVLAIYGVLRTVFGNFSSLFLSLQRQDYVAKMSFFRVFVLLILLIPFITSFGMIGASYAMLISIIAEIPVILLFTYKLFGKFIP